jgi:catechol-2,3-dioxygenase
MSMLFKRIDTVFLKVKNFEKAIKWYSDVLGFSVRWVHEEGGYAALEIGETPLTLVRANENFKPVMEAYFNFYVPDLNDVYKHLKSYDVEVTDIVDHGDVQTFDFKDPDGNTLSVCHFAE